MRRVAVAVGLMLVTPAGCSHEAAVFRVPPEVDTPPVVEPLADPITLAVEHPAAAYDEDAPGEPGSDAMVGSAARGPLHDHRLDAAAVELLAVVRQGGTLSPELVQFATHAHGIVEPPTFYLTEPPAEVLEPPNTRVGVAGALTLVIHAGPVRFTALPRAASGTFELRATLAPPYAHPRVTVTGDDGSVAHPPVTVDGSAFRAQITCAGTRSWITVDADEPRPLAVVPVACGTAPAVFRIEPDSNLQTNDVERRLTALINRERIAAQLAPLRTDRRTTLAAAGYARVMMRASDVAHDLAGVPQTRIADVGRRPLLVEETTFRAADLAEASMVLLDDPAARTQVLSKSATHLGIGVARSASGELFVAIDYIQILPPTDCAALEARVVRQLVEQHHTRRLLRPSMQSERTYVPGPPIVDDELTDRARGYARMAAVGWSAATIDSALKRALPTRTRLYEKDPRRRFWRINKQVIEVTDPATVDESKLFSAGAIVDAIGVGVAQSAQDGWLSGRVYVVILYARH